MTYIHIVSFAYPSSTSDSTKAEVFTRFKSLKQQCKTQEGKTYILDLQASETNISPEGAGKNLEVSHIDDAFDPAVSVVNDLMDPICISLLLSQHTFILTYASAKDFKYYLDEDAAHVEFKVSFPS